MSTDDHPPTCRIQPPPLPTQPPSLRWDQHPEVPPPTTWSGVLDALLKHPAALLRGIEESGSASPALRLWLLAHLGMLSYGVVVGLFAGGWQLWVVPLKLSLGLLLSAAICWPSLYILVCLGGGKQTPAQVVSLLGSVLALMTTLMVGFAPVAWVFSQSTASPGFMGTLHLVLWGVCCGFALKRLAESLHALNGSPVGTAVLWNIVFVLVCLQMTTALRPLLGPFDGWHPAPRQFFLQHWAGGAVTRPPDDASVPR